MENPIKMDDLGVPYFWFNTHVYLIIMGSSEQITVDSMKDFFFLRSLGQNSDDDFPFNGRSPLKIGRWKDRLPTSNFQVQTVSFREGIYLICVLSCPLPKNNQAHQTYWGEDF